MSSINRAQSGMRSSLILGLVLGVLLSMQSAAQTVTNGDPELGRQLYQHGITASGTPYEAIAEGDIRFSGNQFSCISCHRPSGFGTSEGGNYVPPITGPILFEPTRPDRNRRFKELFQEYQPAKFWAQVRQPRTRPAYTEQSLRHLLRTGVDPARRALNPIMPRYELSDEDMANLIAYLKTLSAAVDPGVEADTIHFATVFNSDSDPQERKAVSDTIEAFFEWMNKDTRGDLSHPSFSPYYRTEFLKSYRLWKLHVWELHGAPETWPDQLHKLYAQYPVFALVSGLVQGPWGPVAGFCDSEAIPCLFPNTLLPKPGDKEGGYSLHFSRGLEQEAEALAKYLGQTENSVQRIVQIHAQNSYGQMPASVFSGAASELLPNSEITDFSYDSKEGLEELLGNLAQGDQGGSDVLVLWPGASPAMEVAALNSIRPEIPIIILPSQTLAFISQSVADDYRERIRISYPYEIPTAYHPRQFRVRGWMRTRRVTVSHPQLQLQTYYALTMLQFGLVHMLDDFHRDYLIELIEHEAENELNPGIYPSMALGPGQRVTSKGVYIIRLDPAAKGGFVPVSEWLIP